MLRTFVCISLLVVLLPQSGQCATKTDYYNLYDHLFNNYKKEVRPAENEHSTMKIYLLFNFLSLDEIDEKQQAMVSTARLDLDWGDDFLAWNSTEYGGISSLLIPQDKVYLPDIVVSNSGSEQKRIGYEELQVRLWDNGVIQWQPTILLSTSCDIDITYFPFDTQKCYIEFKTAMSTKNEIDVSIKTGKEAFSVDEYSENGQWELVDYKAENQEDTAYKTRMRFGVVIKRRTTFYILFIIFPIFFLSLCSSLVFALPADEGEKMGTGITVLLAFAVYLTILSELIPNTSLQVSVLGVYLTVLLGLSALSIITCVFILRLHFREDGQPVGPMMTNIIHFLRKMLCFSSMEDVAGNQVSPGHSEETASTHDGKKDTSSVCRSPIQLSVDGPSKHQLTWQDVSYTLDWFCFILFTLLTCLFTFIILLFIDVGASHNAPAI